MKAARAPQSVTVELADEIDLSRGEMLVAVDQVAPHNSTRLRAMCVWMHEQPLVSGATYMLKHTTRTVRATVRAIRYRVDVNSAEHFSADQIAMNDIAEVELETNLPLFFDSYAENRSTGSFILIDPLSNATLGAGMLLAPFQTPLGEEVAASKEHCKTPTLVLLPGDPEGLRALQLELQREGRMAIIVDDPQIPETALPAVVRALQLAEVIALSANATLLPNTLHALRAVAGEGYLEGHHALAQWKEGK